MIPTGIAEPRHSLRHRMVDLRVGASRQGLRRGRPRRTPCRHARVPERQRSVLFNIFLSSPQRSEDAPGA